MLVTNNGPNLVEDIVIRDKLTMQAGTISSVPSTEFATTHGTGWSIVSRDATTLLMEATIDQLGVGEIARLDFMVIVLIDPQLRRTELTNTSDVKGSLPDPILDNNTDTITTVIQRRGQ